MKAFGEIQPQMEFKSVTEIAGDAKPLPNTQTIFIGINFHHFWLLEVANFKSSLRHPIFILGRETQAAKIKLAKLTWKTKKC